jgi:hypothetical protein
VVTQGQFALEFDALLWAIFNTTQAGTINGEVQWTYPTNTMLIVVTEGACTAQQLIDQQCRMIHTSLGTAPKPRTFSLPGRAAGTHTLMVGNAGPGDDAIAYQVVLNPSASAAASAEAAPPAASLGTLDLRRFKRHVSAARP